MRVDVYIVARLLARVHQSGNRFSRSSGCLLLHCEDKRFFSDFRADLTPGNESMRRLSAA